MNELVDFLLARIAEDEEMARAVSGATVVGEPYNWRPVDTGDEWEPNVDRRNGDVEVLVALRPGVLRPGDVMSGMWGQVVSLVESASPDDGLAQEAALADHIARHDPARVLAECEAKRRIVDLLTDARRIPWDGLALANRDVLQFLALPYAAHPAYRDEWRP